jgi:hypothetical protein
VAPTGTPGEQWVVLEHATRALSPAAGRKFRRYWDRDPPDGRLRDPPALKAVARLAKRDH